MDSSAPANITNADGHSSSYHDVLEDEDSFLKMYGVSEGTFAKLQFLGVAGFAFLYAALYKFKYEIIEYKDFSEVSTDTNWFGLAASIRYYSMTVLFGVGFVT